MKILLPGLLFAFPFLPSFISGFTIGSGGVRRTVSCRALTADDNNGSCGPTRRSVLTLGSIGVLALLRQDANAAVGSLPEFADANAILQGITIKVADKSQQNAMIAFLEEGFGFQILRKRIQASLEETWLGFGPEQLSIPSDFVIPVSAFSQYGGHASVHIVYDEKAQAPLYRIGDAAPGDNIAFLQVGVPEYRISRMVQNGGNILDAYGLVNVVSPSGLPMRGIIGISPDPIMFIAINCINVESSKEFYQQLGFVEQKYPYARPSNGTGQFEPPQPPKSVYMAPTNNCIGVLLLPTKGKKRLSPNPVVESLNIVYNPSPTAADDADADGSISKVVDPSGVPIKFQSVRDFEVEVEATV